MRIFRCKQFSLQITTALNELAKFIMRLKLTNKQTDFKRIMSFFSAYLIINFIVNLFLVFLHFEIESIGNIMFTITSAVIPLISIIETFLNYGKCLKFLEEASRMRGEIDRQMLSLRIIGKGLFIVFVIMIQIFIIIIRCTVFCTIPCNR